MPEMYIKYRGDKPYAYMYGDEDAAAALYYGDGYNDKNTQYCPHCGARMDRKDRNG